MAEGDIEHGHVDTNDTVKLLLKNYEEVQYSSSQHRGSILMVHSVYRDLSPHSFTPRVVSIGPLHHQDKHLKGFEVHKVTYMHTLLREVLSPRLLSTPEQILEECVMKVRGSADRIKACYVGMQTCPDSELVQMMVTDACFIFAFLVDTYIGLPSLATIRLLELHIYLDMLLIENQIPFFVLEDIFECTFSKLLPRRTLANFIFVIQNICHIFEGDLVKDNSGISTTHDHILGFLQKSYQIPDRDSSTCPGMIKAHSAVELDRSGVRFSAKCDAKLAMELKYSRFLCFPLSWSKPTLKMPVLGIHDHSELFIRNLIIYERCAGVQPCVTSYMYALDFLIDTPEDVAKLVKSQVLINYIGSNEEAANLINNICKEVPLEEFYYHNELKLLNDHYNARWPKLIAELRRNYFSKPWSIIALLAGIVLFVLTVVQTVYGVKAV